MCFADYRSSDIITKADISTAHVQGQLMVHTQKALFKFDPTRDKSEILTDSRCSDSTLREGFERCHIHSATGRLVGEVWFHGCDARPHLSST
jgi:hypothetical protein